MSEDPDDLFYNPRVTLAEIINIAGQSADDLNDSDIAFQCSKCSNDLRADWCEISGSDVTVYKCPFCKTPLLTIADAFDIEALLVESEFDGYLLRNVVVIRALHLLIPISTPLFLCTA